MGGIKFPEHADKSRNASIPHNFYSDLVLFNFHVPLCTSNFRIQFAALIQEPHQI